MADLKPNQTDIYYLVGESIERLKASPKLEAARARGVEVLLLTDPVDAFWTAMPLGFEGKPLKSLSQGDVDFGLVPLLEDEEGRGSDRGEGERGRRCRDHRRGQGGARRAGLRRARLAAPDRQRRVPGGRRRRARTASSSGCWRARPAHVGAKPILEINTRHALVKALADAKLAAREADVADLAELLLDQAQILDGLVPDDPAAFARRLNRMVVKGFAGG